VAKAFAPIDPLRTALATGVLGDEEDIEDAKYYRSPRWSINEQFEKVRQEPSDDPKYRTPLGEDAQIYELRRLFRI
jgi:hypothetical protein